MAGVFMILLDTTWVRTRLMPRWLAFLTYVLALGLLLTISSNPRVTLIFPAGVCVVSGYILVSNLRAPRRARHEVKLNSTSLFFKEGNLRNGK
jgi:hypothetical protein